MEKEKYENTKEDIEFLRKFKLFLGLIVLSVLIAIVCKCSHDDLVENGKTIDHTGIVVDDPNAEENGNVLRRIK